MARTRSFTAFSTIAALLLLLGTAAPASAGALSNITFRIKPGKHGDSNGLKSGLKCMQFKTRVNRTLRFQVKFHPNSAYTTRSASNQSDNNKCMGITTTNFHGGSLRLGWAYNPTNNKMRLRFYGYMKGQRISHELTQVNLNEWVNVELQMNRDFLRASANGASFTKNGSMGFSRGFPTLTFMLKTCYFGGDETQPNSSDMNISVRNISIRG
ncbi:MAG: hypothetical protein ACYTFT_03755 [Planctomycetota bacterium]